MREAELPFELDFAGSKERGELPSEFPARC
jgi:hypothetical protein